MSRGESDDDSAHIMCALNLIPEVRTLAIGLHKLGECMALWGERERVQCRTSTYLHAQSVKF